MDTKQYNIIESGIGPLIDHSRSTVYDVMKAYDEGNNLYEISRLYNLTPLQVETALQYISKHRQKLEPELKEILIKKAEYERYHRAIQAEAWKRIAQLPMTPERAKFYAKREELRRRRAAEESKCK
jgi:uncharacterized protein (DUF433 family)